MRALRVLGMIVVVAATGLLGGGAAAAPAAVGHLAAPAAVAPTVIAPAAAGAAVVVPAAVAPAVAAPAVAAPAVVVPATVSVPRQVVSGTPCRSTTRACIELSSNRAWLIRDGVIQYGPVPITHGRKGFRTPPGTFQVTFKNRHHVSSIYNSPMPYSVFFNGGIAFHEGSLNELSHGCIHLSRTAARTFFESLNPGDVVQVV